MGLGCLRTIVTAVRRTSDQLRKANVELEEQFQELEANAASEVHEKLATRARTDAFVGAEKRPGLEWS